MVNIGNLTAAELWVGSVKVDFAFIGNKQVWGGGGGSSVHYIDYINTNRAELVTDYTPNSSTWIEGRFRGDAVGNYFVGTTDTMWRFFNSQNTFYVDVNGMGNRIDQYGWNTTEWYDLSAGNCFFTCVPDSGTTLSQTGWTESTTYSYPFALGSSTYSWGGQYEEFDCAGFKIWEGNTLIRDYRPAKDANGVVCMYEEVSGTYCYPTNSGGVFLGYEIIGVPTKVRYTAASGLPAWEGNIVGQIVGSSGQATTQIPNISSAISIEPGTKVTGIGDYAFYNCSNLSSITMTDAIKNIGSYAFNACTGLNEITLLDRLSSIAATSFDNCSNLSSVNWTSKNISDVYNMADYPWGLANGTTIHCSNADLIVGQSPATEATLCFTAQEANSTVRLDKVGSPNAISLQTSTDGHAWTDYSWSGITGSTLTLANVGDKVYMRAKNRNTTISSSANDHYKFVMTGTLSASGNVDTLLDQSGAITLTSFCYTKLFMGCTSLTTAPALPSTTLAQSCYASMFNGCTSLSAAPELPATTLTNYCYTSMFYNCSSLTTAPALPATTLAQGCYRSMFQGCSSLTTAPQLLATTLVERCYTSMFSGCSSLTTAPILPATTLAQECYAFMFNNCSNLSSITLGYTGNFSSTHFNNWVNGVAASGIFYYNGTDTTQGASAIPTGWTSLPIPRPELCFTAREANSTVSMAKSGSAPTVSLEYCTDGTAWRPFVVGTTTVTLANIGDRVWLRATSTNNAMASWANDEYNYFVMTGQIAASGNINSLLNGPDPDAVTTAPVYAYVYLFQGCSALVDAIDLVLPSTTAQQNSYGHGMFYNCTNLVGGPTIMATNLLSTDWTAEYMFQGCSSLASVKIYATGSNWGGNSTVDWMDGVPSTGTFYYNGTYTGHDTSHIPTGWTITPFTP